MRTDQELLEYAKKNGIHAGNIDTYQQPQYNMPSGAPASGKAQTIADLMYKINPILGNTVAGAARGGAQAFGGVTIPDTQNDYSKLYAQEAIKKQFQDPRDNQIKDLRVKTLQAGIDTDEEGNPIKAVNPQVAEREKRMREFEGRRQASTLRGELNTNQYVKRFQEMNSAARGIDAMLTDTLSRPDNTSKNVGDQALITLYNKILDPLSVVRESEYARTPDGQSLLNRIAGFTQKVASGGAGLTDQDRVEIARAAKTLINQSGDTYNSKLDEYGHLADVYEVDPNMVTSGFDRFSPYDVNSQYGGQQAQVPNQQVQPNTQQTPTVGGMFNGKPVKSVKRIR